MFPTLLRRPSFEPFGSSVQRLIRFISMMVTLVWLTWIAILSVHCVRADDGLVDHGLVEFLIQKYSEDFNAQAINLYDGIRGNEIDIEAFSDTIPIYLFGKRSKAISVPILTPTFVILDIPDDLFSLDKTFPQLSVLSLYPIAVIVRSPFSDKEDVIENLCKNILYKRAPRFVTFIRSGENNASFTAYGCDVVDKTKTRAVLLDLYVSSQQKFILGGSRLFHRKSMDFQGQMFRAATFPLPPFTKEMPDGDLGGFEVKTFDTIAKILNFDYNVSFIKGTWNGLVDHLHHHRADFGWAHFFQTETRNKLIDFTRSFDTDNYCFFVAKPKDLPQWISIALPFSPLSWTFIILAYFACCLFIWLYTILDLNMSLSKGLVFVSAAFVDENTEMVHKIKSNSFRVFCITFLLACLVLTTGYKGSLFSFLTAPLRQKPINSLKEVVESPYTIGSVGNVIKADLYKSPEELYQKFDAKYRLYGELNLTMDQAIKKASERELIVYENRQMLEYRIRRDFTNSFGETSMHIASDCSRPFNICFGLPKNSPFTEALSEVIVRLKEAGITRKFFVDEMDSVAKIAEDSTVVSEKREPLNLNHLQGVFILLGMTSVLSFLVFVVEVFRFKAYNV